MSEQKQVRALISSSSGVDGTMYHPSTEGTLMPLSVAKLLGATILDEKQVKKEEVKETILEETASEEPTEAVATALPTDTPEYDSLIADERFNTVEGVLENQAQLTSVKGIGKATASKIIAHFS